MTWPATALITGIKMHLSYMLGSTPVYTWFADGTQYNYINHNLKPEDLK